MTLCIEADYEIFNRESMLEFVPRINQYLMALRELIRGLPEDVDKFQTYYAIMTDLYNALNHFLSAQKKHDTFFSWTSPYLRVTGKLYGLEKPIYDKIIKAYKEIYRLNDIILNPNTTIEIGKPSKLTKIITGLDIDNETKESKMYEMELAEETLNVCGSIVDAILALNEKIPHPDFKINEKKIEGLIALKDWPKLVEVFEEAFKKLTPEQLKELSKSKRKTE